MGDFSVAVLSLAACVLAASAAAKLRSRRAYRLFRDGLGETRLLPEHLLSPAAAALVGAEALIAAGLTAAAVLTATAAPGAIPLADCALAAAAFLILLLAAGIAVVMHRGTRAHCAGAGWHRAR